MEGRGVTNYDVSKPNYNITTSTTEFDDELMKRNIVSFEQCMIAKGATPQQARQLSQIKKQEDTKTHAVVDGTPSLNTYKDNDDDDDARYSESSLDDEEYDDDDDDFMEKYRNMRLQQMKVEGQERIQKFQSKQYGHLKPIKRSEWMTEVNDASRTRRDQNNISMTTSVLVYLSPHPNSDPFPELQVEQTIETLAKRYSYIKFVKIDYQDAIPNWPISNLPTLFIYQNGKATHQLIGLTQFLEMPVDDNDANNNDSDYVDNENESIVYRALETKMRDWGIIIKGLGE